MGTLGEVRGYGCEAEFYAIIDCSLENRIFCTDDTTCQGAVDRAWLCYRDGYYCDSFSRPPGTCSITCGEWGARCDPGPNGPRCTCTDGPRSGEAFSTTQPCSSNLWPSEVRSRCQYAPE
jgi:hypothetical protein